MRYNKIEVLEMNNNVLELINEIPKVSSVEGIDDSMLDALKFKAIEILSAYAIEKSKNEDYWKYHIVESPDFGAYISTDRSTGKTSLVFRQELNVTMHYRFSTAEEIIKGMYHIYGNQNKNTETMIHK